MALLIITLILVLFYSFYLLAGLRTGGVALGQRRDSAIALGQARQALLVWGVSTATLAPPGLLPMPDRRQDGNYDGLSDCVVLNYSHPAWVPPKYLMGRFPWRGEDTNCSGREPGVTRGADMSVELKDAYGEYLWYAVAPALIHYGGKDEYGGNSTLLLQDDENWLQVCDVLGRHIPRVAFVILAAGPSLSGQQREGERPMPRHFLDARVLNGVGPCNGRISNADPDSLFVEGLASTNFNDQLIYVTAEDYYSRIVVNVAQQLRASFSDHVERYGAYPWAAVDVKMEPGACQAGLSSGRIPVETDDECTGFVVLPLWAGSEDENSWLQAARYTRHDTRRASLQFDGCAIVFTFETRSLPDAKGVRTSLTQDRKHCGADDRAQVLR